MRSDRAELRTHLEKNTVSAMLRLPVPPRRVVRAALALRRGLRWLSDLVVPPELALVENHVNGALHAAVVSNAARLGLVDALLAHHGDLASVAREKALDASGLERLCRALCALGLLRQVAPGRVLPTRQGRCLRSGGRHSMRALAQWIGSPAMQRAWAALPTSLTQERDPFLEGNGADVWTWLSAEPERETLFADAMATFTTLTGPAIARAFPFDRAGALCDVAGGQGTLLAAILERYRELRATLTDRAPVLERARDFLRSRGVAARVQLEEGDLFRSLPAGFDTYLLKDVLHDWDDETCRSLLRVLRRSTAPGARVLVIEDLLGEGVESAFAPFADATMWVATPGGRQRTVAQHAALLEATGFRFERTWRSAYEVSLVEARAV